MSGHRAYWDSLSYEDHVWATKCYKMLQACDDHRFTEQCSLDDWLLAVFAAIKSRRTKQGPIKWGQCIQVTAAEACTS